MKGDDWLYLIIMILVIILVVWWSYAIYTADIPLWLKFLLM